MEDLTVFLRGIIHTHRRDHHLNTEKEILTVLQKLENANEKFY